MLLLEFKDLWGPTIKMQSGPLPCHQLLHRSHRLLENKFLGNKTNMYPSENCM